MFVSSVLIAKVLLTTSPFMIYFGPPEFQNAHIWPNVSTNKFLYLVQPTGTAELSKGPCYPLHCRSAIPYQTLVWGVAFSPNQSSRKRSWWLLCMAGEQVGETWLVGNFPAPPAASEDVQSLVPAALLAAVALPVLPENEMIKIFWH